MTGLRHRMFLYRGLSMWPSFQEGDLLEVAPVPLKNVRVGDCVLLHDTDGRHLVHRVISLQGGLSTRGDAMPRADRYGETPPELVGKVVARYRLGQRSVVAGGLAGRLAGFSLRYAGRIDPARAGRGGRVARGIRRCCVPLTKHFLAQGETKRVMLAADAESAILYLGGKAVAQRRGAHDEWQVYWPWRVFVRLAEGNLTT